MTRGFVEKRSRRVSSYNFFQLFNFSFTFVFLLFLGHTPDVLAFIITLLMMVVLALGVKKSLIFNNVLNVINFAAWVFIMSAGLFYVRLENWNDFLPRGWAGVSTSTGSMDSEGD